MWRCTRGETEEDRGRRKVTPVSWRQAAWRTSGNQWRLPSVPEHASGAESSAVGARGWYLCSRRLPKNRQRPCIILIHTSERQWSSKYEACSFIQRENMQQQVSGGELFGMPPLNIHAHILGIVRAPLSFFFNFRRSLQPPPQPNAPPLQTNTHPFSPAYLAPSAMSCVFTETQPTTFTTDVSQLEGLRASFKGGGGMHIMRTPPTPTDVLFRRNLHTLKTCNRGTFHTFVCLSSNMAALDNSRAKSGLKGDF